MDKPYEFSLHFGGYSYIDAETFISSVDSLNKVIQEINKELNEEKKLQLTLYPPTEGSFECICALLADASIMGAVENLIRKETIEYAAGVITILTGYLQLKKFLNGEKAEVDTNSNKAKDGSLIVSNKSGDILEVNASVVNIYQNNVIVDRAVSSMFDKLDKSFYVKDFQISDKEKGKLFEAPKKTFTTLSTKSDFTVDKDKVKIEIDDDANIYVNKIVFSADQKWQGIYNSQKINFKISDKNFIEKTQHAEVSFTSSSIINCNLSMTLVLDEDSNQYIIDQNQYKIVEVKSIRDGASQTEMKF